MITGPKLFFEKGCGRCKKFATEDCKARIWGSGLAELRRICLSEGLEETAKWGHPCYVYSGRNIAILGAFKSDFRVNFLNASLLEDRDGVLQKQGENSQTATMMSFASRAAVLEAEPKIREFLTALKGFAEQGVKPEKQAVVLEYPDELVAALDAEPALAEAFEALTPGRKRSYVLFVNGAKQSATRMGRIEKSREKIFAGKGALER